MGCVLVGELGTPILTLNNLGISYENLLMHPTMGPLLNGLLYLGLDLPVPN